MYWSEHRGIYFVEGVPEFAKPLAVVNTELNDFFSQNHLKSLDDLKDRMAVAVAELGGNALIEFKYGQRSSFWKSIFGMDNVLWFGSGRAARVDPIAIKKS